MADRCRAQTEISWDVWGLELKSIEIDHIAASHDGFLRASSSMSPRHWPKHPGSDITYEGDILDPLRNDDATKLGW